jgi:predicted secreted hydrolase
MKNYIIQIIVILLLLNTLALNCLSSLSNKNKAHPIKDIVPRDDAFHHIKKGFSIEWWYFDAVFKDNYGVHIGIKIITFGKWGFVRQLINIYNESKVEEKAYVTKPLNQFQISREFPDIKHKNKHILKFDRDEYNKTGDWNYNVNLDVKDISVNLNFVGKSKGFKYKTTHEGWTVAQPKAKVNGILKINDEAIEVSGKGYHDHNWNFSLSTALRAKGWYWGKVTSDNYTLTWAKIIKTSFADETILKNFGILNVIDQGYTIIDPKNITLDTAEREFHNGRFIPTLYKLKIKQDDIDIDITFNAVSIQRAPPRFLTIHYWRYFVSVNGYIKVGENTDYLNNNLQIIEFMRFI